MVLKIVLICAFLFWIFQFVLLFRSLVLITGMIQVVYLSQQNVQGFEASILVSILLLVAFYIYQLKKKQLTLIETLHFFLMDFLNFLILILEVGIGLYAGIAIFTSPEFHNFNPILVFITNTFIAFLILEEVKKWAKTKFETIRHA